MKKIEADIIVISAGSAGMAAAVAAAERGVRVIALEKTGVTGGTANMAMGLFAVESRLQRLKQMALTCGEAFNIHMDFTRWRVDARLVKAYIDKSPDTIDWLEKMGVEFADIGCHGNSNNFTWHIVKGTYTAFGQGGLAGAMMDKLAERARELGVDIHLKTTVKKILKENGHITGVIAETEDGQSLQVNAGAVIIACGGKGMGLATGDGLRMAQEIGAAVKINPEEPISPGFPPQAGPPGPGSSNRNLLSEDEREMINQAFDQPNLLVNLHGERFANEEICSCMIFRQNPLLRQKDGRSIMIFDEETKNYYIEHGFDIVTGYILGSHVPRDKATGFDEIIRRLPEGSFPSVIIAGSIEELAAKTGVNPHGLAKTVEEYNHACDTGRDKILNKDPRYLRPVRTPNFYACSGPGKPREQLYEGIIINYKTEVQNEDYETIPGLYAAGIDTACNVYYDTYPNILPGNNLGYAINSGRMAGENAADYVKALNRK